MYLFAFLQSIRYSGSTSTGQKSQNTSDGKSKTIGMKLLVSITSFLKDLLDNNSDSESESAPELKNTTLFTHLLSSFYFLSIFLHIFSLIILPLAYLLKKNGGLGFNLAF